MSKDVLSHSLHVFNTLKEFLFLPDITFLSFIYATNEHGPRADTGVIWKRVCMYYSLFIKLDI